jgi:hypothetical protein
MSTPKGIAYNSNSSVIYESLKEALRWLPDPRIGEELGK